MESCVDCHDFTPLSRFTGAKLPFQRPGCVFKLQRHVNPDVEVLFSCIGMHYATFLLVGLTTSLYLSFGETKITFLIIFLEPKLRQIITTE